MMMMLVKSILFLWQASFFRHRLCVFILIQYIVIFKKESVSFTAPVDLSLVGLHLWSASGMERKLVMNMCSLIADVMSVSCRNQI